MENGSSYRHSVDYEYDDDQNLTQLVNTINESVLTTAYTYDKDNRIVNLLNTLLVSEDEIAGTSAAYTYDSFGRLSGKTIQENAVNILTVGYQFEEGAENGATSARVSELKLNEDGDGFRRTYAYTYDDNGNLLSVSDGTNTTTYVYDSANQLIRENNQAADKTWVWTYDNAGNILAKTEYPYTTGENPSNGTTVAYAYGDTLGWGDLLTGYNNHTISYDTIGNPVTVENSAGEVVLEYTWEHGRQLAGLHGVDMNGGENDVTVSYTYNADGIRTGKTVTTKVYITHVHSYTVSESVMPTCTQGGYILYACSCGDQYTDEMAALGHDFRADSGLIPTTTCRRCGASRVPTLPIEPPGGTIILGEGSGAEIMGASAEGERILVSTVLTEYEYIYTGTELTQMIVTTTVDDQSPTTQTLYFTYETGGPMTVTCDGTTYYYAANLQGDIIAILDAGGNAVVEYTYDAWGNILDISGELAATLGETNPLTYRGYVYDHETRLYYCQSRYYNPEIGRFINADAFASTGQGLLGSNMFAYCGNNPVNRADPSGQSWSTIWEGIKEAVRDILHTANDIATWIGFDTAGIGAVLLGFSESSPGVYHASADCWQQLFGYNGMYDFVFDLGTSMIANRYEFSHDGVSYAIWAWKGDYVNLGAGAELGIYYGGGPHWLVDTNLSMQMSMSLSYCGKEIISYSQNTWWITGFNSNYLNVQASQLSVCYTIYFNNPAMFNSFSRTWNGMAGWTCNPRNYSATLSF